jgi:hypothetical protein
MPYIIRSTRTITVLGRPSIKPYDMILISDTYSEMEGICEVEQVVHTFNKDTGFCTEITPDLHVTVNNVNYGLGVAGLMLDGVNLDGGWARSFRKFLKSFMGTSGKQRTVEVARTNRIGFIPLLYKGEPYIGGIDPRKGHSWGLVSSSGAALLVPKLDEYTREKAFGENLAKINYAMRNFSSGSGDQ